MARLTHDYDGAWKHAGDRYLADLLAYTFPRIHAQIDWRQPVLDRNGELAALGPAPGGVRRTDRLIEVQRRRGSPALLQIEFQAQRDANFAARILDYVRRISDRLQLPLGVLVILTDQSMSWRPRSHIRGWAGTRYGVSFATFKLIDRPLDDVLRQTTVVAALDQMVRLSRITRGDDARLQAFTQVFRHVVRQRPRTAGELVDLLRFGHHVLPVSAARRLEMNRSAVNVLMAEGMMQETRFLAPFEVEAEERGKEIGKEIGERQLLLTQLQHRVGRLGTAELTALEQLDAPQRQMLARALFDLQSLAELQAWLRTQRS